MNNINNQEVNVYQNQNLINYYCHFLKEKYLNGQVSKKLTMQNHHLFKKLTQMQQELDSKNEYVSDCVYETKKQLSNEFQMEKYSLLNGLRKMKQREKNLEDSLQQHKNEIIYLKNIISEYKNSSANKNRVEENNRNLIEKLKQTVHILDDFEDLLNQFFTTSINNKTEIQNLYSDVHRIDQDRCRQLDLLRSVYSDINKICASRAQQVPQEFNRLNVERQQFSENNVFEEHNFDQILKKERNLNIQLKEEILKLKCYAEQNERNFKIEMFEKIARKENELTEIHKRETEKERGVLKIEFKCLNNMLDELMEYQIRMYTNTVSKLKNKNLSLQKILQDHLKLIIKKEKSTSNKLRDEIFDLKLKENKSKVIVELKIKEELRQQKEKIDKIHKTVVDKLNEDIEELRNREQTLKSELSIARMMYENKNNLLIEKNEQIENLKITIKNLQERLLKQGLSEKKWQPLKTLNENCLNSEPKNINEIKQYLKLIKQNQNIVLPDFSAGDPGVTTMNLRKRVPLTPELYTSSTSINTKKKRKDPNLSKSKKFCKVTKQSTKIIRDSTQYECIAIKKRTYCLSPEVLNKMGEDLNQKIGLKRVEKII